LLLAIEQARRNPTPQPSWESGAACVEVTNTAARIGLFVFGQLTYATVPIGNLMPRGA
jgi:hypothetical protein